MDRFGRQDMSFNVIVIYPIDRCKVSVSSRHLRKSSKETMVKLTIACRGELFQSTTSDSINEQSLVWNNQMNNIIFVISRNYHINKSTRREIQRHT